MAKKKFTTDFSEVPETLENHQFYGLELDDEQKAFRDAIWDKSKLIIFCDAKAGTGKTTIATGVANLLVNYKLYDGIVYIASPTQEQKQGYLPGSIEDKSEPYFEPFYEALQKIGVNTNTAITSDIENQKFGTAYITTMVHTFMRGCNFENKVVLIDESQNFFTDELKKVLTRFHDSCKVIVIGHHDQCDLYHHPERSGFVRYLEHFKGDDRCAVCTLTKNYRGWISTHADELST